MAQYRIGTASVTNGSQIITGTGTAWLANVHVGDIFTLAKSGLWYEVGSVDSNEQIKVTAPYAGISATGQPYVISASFTPVSGLPYPENGDIETAAILKRALLQLDSDAPASKLNTADFFTDFCHSGFIPSVPNPASLIMKTPSGVAYINGLRVVKGEATYTYAANSDTYVDLSDKGVFSYVAVANGAAAPAATANSLRMFKVVTSASAVTQVTRLAADPPLLFVDSDPVDGGTW